MVGFDWIIYIAIAASIMASATAAYASYQSGQAQKKAGEFNAQVAEQNAKATKQKAEFEEEQHRYKAKLLMGTQIANYAASGIDVTVGTPLDVLAEQAFQFEKEAIAIRYGADITSSQYLSQASGQRFQGSTAATAGTVTAAGTILQGAGSAASTYYKMKSPSTSTGM